MFIAEQKMPVRALRRRLRYEAKTGALIWICGGKGRRHEAGARAGTIEKSGYRRIRLSHRAYAAHRVAWALYYGEWPPGFLDHINRDRDDNRISNLRIATNSQNQANVGRCRRNTSGYKGVSYDKGLGKWRAAIRRGGPPQTIGLFGSPEDAHAAYLKKAVAYFGEFARAA
jgi:Demerecviridae HNH endonuclease